jgi:hypothetical protein
MNKLAVLALPFLAAWLAGRLHLAATGKRLPHRLGEPLSGRWVLAVVLCYWIARNLLPLLAPFPQ